MHKHFQEFLKFIHSIPSSQAVTLGNWSLGKPLIIDNTIRLELEYVIFEFSRKFFIRSERTGTMMHFRKISWHFLLCVWQLKFCAREALSLLKFFVLLITSDSPQFLNNFSSVSISGNQPLHDLSLRKFLLCANVTKNLIKLMLGYLILKKFLPSHLKTLISPISPIRKLAILSII